MPIGFNIAATVAPDDVVWLNTAVDFVSRVAIATLPIAIYEPFMVEGNSSTRALDAALSNKLRHAQTDINTILAGAYQLQWVRWDNQAPTPSSGITY